MVDQFEYLDEHLHSVLTDVPSILLMYTLFLLILECQLVFLFVNESHHPINIVILLFLFYFHFQLIWILKVSFWNRPTVPIPSYLSLCGHMVSYLPDPKWNLPHSIKEQYLVPSKQNKSFFVDNGSHQFRTYLSFWHTDFLCKIHKNAIYFGFSCNKKL